MIRKIKYSGNENECQKEQRVKDPKSSNTKYPE